MKKTLFTIQELKFTAVLYAHNHELLEHLVSTGRLPKKWNHRFPHLSARALQQERGLDPELKLNEC